MLQLIEFTSLQIHGQVGMEAEKHFKSTRTEARMHNWLVVSTPLKNISQLGWLFPIYGKIKNVPNHQPDNLGHVGM